MIVSRGRVFRVLELNLLCKDRKYTACNSHDPALRLLGIVPAALGKCGTVVRSLETGLGNKCMAW